MTVREHWITAEEFLAIKELPENEGKRLELVDGVVVEDMAGGGSGQHGEVAGNIHGFIWNFARSNKLGRVTAAETCFRLFHNPDGKDVIRCPDVGFVMYQRAPEPFGTGLVPFAPDLAVEVVSPGNTAEEMHERIRDFLQYGTRMVLEAFPETVTMVVYTPDGSKTFEADDTFDGGDVLPGFSMTVREMFKA